MSHLCQKDGGQENYLTRTRGRGGKTSLFPSKELERRGVEGTLLKGTAGPHILSGKLSHYAFEKEILYRGPEGRGKRELTTEGPVKAEGGKRSGAHLLNPKEDNAL